MTDTAPAPRTGVDPDVAHLSRALALAERGRATARPNPLVGCVVVRDGTIVGEGWHARPGAPHAEVVALDAAGDAGRDATAYVSLEPCDHHGRTPPCTGAIVRAGVRRVVYAAADPHPQAAGGAATLRGAGLEVHGGLLAGWAEAQNEVFLTATRLGRPFVTLKLAQTHDGALAVPDRRWITSRRARAAVHGLRARADAVLVGSGTVLADDPRLDVRHVATTRQPVPLVLDGRGRTPTDAAVARPGALVVTTAASPAAWRRALEGRGARVEVVAPGRAPDGMPHGVALHEALRVAGAAGVQAVLAEPGAEVAAALVRAGLADRLILHVARAAPDRRRPDGGTGRGTAPTRPADPQLPACVRAAAWRGEARRPLGPDVELRLRPVRAHPIAGAG